MGSRFSLHRSSLLTQTLWLAIGYFVLGRLALLMAIPPGYATPVWPAAGLAVVGLLAFGYRAWPGVVLGSFCINLPTTLATGHPALQSAVVAASLGLGAALQALTGAFLVRRLLPEPLAFGQPRQLGALLALAGPVACLLSPTLGVTTLVWAGQLSWLDRGFNWFTWWVGDSIGVLLVIPVFLIWVAAPGQLSRRNKITASIPSAIVLALVTLLWARTSALDMLTATMLFTALSSALVLAMARRTTAVREQETLGVDGVLARSIVDTTHDAYIAMDADGRILEWNREAELIFGWTHAEAVGRKLATLVIPERYRQAHARGVAHFLATGEGPFFNQRLELCGLHRNGHEVPVELTIWPTQTRQGYWFNALLHDISTRQRAIQRLTAQETAAKALVESANLAEAAPKILQVVCSALGWRVGAVWTVDANVVLLRCTQFWHEQGRPVPAFKAATRSQTFACGIDLPGRVWGSGKTLFIPDLALEPDFPRAPYAAEDGLRAAFAFPIISSSEVLGVVEFFSDSIEPPDEGLLKMMDTLAHLLGQFVARKLAEIALFEEKKRVEVTLHSIGDGVLAIDTNGRITYLNPIAEDMCGWRADEALGRPVGEVLRIVDQQTDEERPNPLLLAALENRTVGMTSNSALVRRDGYRAPIEDSAAPIHDHDGRVIGSVMVFHDVSESRAMAMKMSHLAQHDSLTDLPNRVLLQDRLVQALARAERAGQTLALLYMDLDGFKNINDSLGHEVGDLMLQEVAQRLQHCVREMDTVSRQGGDEFVILLPAIRDPSDAARVAENILQAVRRPFRIAGTEYNITLSIGTSVYPHDSSDPGVLLKYADAAMYQAKRQGRNQHRFYTRMISERADRRLSIESSLHQALRDDEFQLYYQPKVLPETGVIAGMEALVRWQQPSGGVFAPGEFMEVAEESGLISRIDLWVLEEACRQNRAWQQAGLPHIPVSVNLAAASANAERFPEHVTAVLARTGLDPACLEIEITENQMLRDTARSETLIRGIKAVGVKVAIDDFGTGYSSLSYLCRFPFDVLKIDQSFVRELAVGSKQIAIVKAITQLARTLGYRVVAEGVETLEQVRILQSHGCHEMQGYLYSRPVPVMQFERLLRGRSIAPAAA